MKTILPFLLLLSLASCRSAMDMQSVSGIDFYAFSDNTDCYGNSRPFPLLYDKDFPEKYEYLNFKLHFEGRRLHLTYDKIDGQEVHTETKVLKGRWRKRGWKYVDTHIILPFFPIFTMEVLDKVYLKPTGEGELEMHKYIREWGFSILFGGGDNSYDYTATFKSKEKVHPSAVFFENGLFGLQQGDSTLLPAQYNEMRVFTQGVSQVQKDGLWGIINTQGEALTPLQYTEIIYNTPYNKPSFFLVKKDNLWGVINLQGEEVLPAEYTQLQYAYYTSLIAQKDGLWGIISTQGKEILPFEYSSISDKHGGYTLQKSDKIGFMGREQEGNWLIPAQYTEIDFDRIYYSKMVLVYKGTTPYFVDREGNEYDTLENKINSADKFFGYPLRDDEVEVSKNYYLRPDLQSKRPINNILTNE